MNNLFKITEDNLENFFHNTSNINSKNKSLKLKSKKNHKTQIFDNNKQNKKKLQTDKNIINLKENSKNDFNKNPEKNTKKVLLEFGKSGINLNKLKKTMGKNLYVMEHISSLFVDFADHFPKLIYASIYDTFKNINKNNSIVPIYSNAKGSVCVINKSLCIDLKNTKVDGLYEIIDCGYLKLTEVNITDSYLKKNKIPDMESIINHSSNMRHIEKVLKILADPTKFKTKSNCMGEFKWLDLDDMLKNILPHLIQCVDKKISLFEELVDSNFTYHIKVYDTHIRAFIIDKKSKLIFYAHTLSNSKSTYLFYYVFELDPKHKIIKLSLDELEKKLPPEYFCNENSDCTCNISDVSDVSSNDTKSNHYDKYDKYDKYDEIEKNINKIETENDDSSLLYTETMSFSQEVYKKNLNKKIIVKNKYSQHCEDV